MTYVHKYKYRDSRFNRPECVSLALQLQGEPAHSLNFFVVCMYVNRKEEE